ncbi:hypothetical protein Sme01_44970 [Sphaerisporangium melleum]|uniref:Uncharacterized protein n=1 Tax=Sphaerisporangium melleum TaxID=321316 RepID=A0A917VI21_9ACTN|nr:hypothetical protein GCM10007964_24120 [Sphaerisporangium melleum]GII72021.1 hypothetical protein Sme01_44970 [Sphaerisporangium melleum]
MLVGELLDPYPERLVKVHKSVIEVEEREPLHGTILRGLAPETAPSIPRRAPCPYGLKVVRGPSIDVYRSHERLLRAHDP